MQGNIKEKVQPVRRCTGCGERFPKRELVRVLRSPEGEILLDLVGKASGRGAYICKKRECFKVARKRGRLEQSLECKIPDEVYDKLEEEISCGNA